MRGWDAEAFVAHLPDLRQAFAALKPQETSDLPDSVLRLHRGGEGGAGASLLQMHYETSEDDLQAGMRLELALAACLKRDGLESWLGPA